MEAGPLSVSGGDNNINIGGLSTSSVSSNSNLLDASTIALLLQRQQNPSAAATLSPGAAWGETAAAALGLSGNRRGVLPSAQSVADERRLQAASLVAARMLGSQQQQQSASRMGSSGSREGGDTSTGQRKRQRREPSEEDEEADSKPRAL